MPRYIYIILILLGLLLLSCEPKPRNNPLDPSKDGRTLNVPSVYTSIQEAINNANSGDTVIVANGTYTGEGNKNISFMGKAITVRSKNGADSTIINCEHSGNGFIFENNEDSLSVLDGFTIKNGLRENGGGILSINSSPIIQNCTIDSCRSFDGGGIKLENSNAKLINCTFSNNSSSAGANTGGGISIDKFSKVLILNCTLIYNTAEVGAGIYINQSSQVHIYSSNFLNNTDSGGCIDVQDSEASIEESYISGNDGIGINSRNSQIILTSSVIKNNNTANLYSYNSIININNSLFTDTLGVYNIRTHTDDIINITYSTLVQTGLQDRPNLFFRSPNVNIINSIIWSNDSLRKPIELDADSINITYSNILGGWPGIGNITGDPAFVSDTDFHLTELSPGVDRASPESSTAFDLEGNARPNSGESLSDIGCYESSFGNSETAAATRLLVPEEYPTIQNAIGTAVAGDTVLIADGHYYENLIIENQSIILASYFLLDNDTSHIENTIIDGDQKDRVIYISNQIEDTTSIFCGFTITNGLAADGGGMYLYNSNPKMYNLVISNNQTNDTNSRYNVGGGMYLNSSSPDMTDITISDNTATSNGGGMYLSSSNPTMTDITISNNTATDDAGGMYLSSSNPTMTDITISNNTATRDAGGIYIAAESSPVFTAISIIDNYAGDGGGGLYLSSSNPTMTDITINANTAAVEGGGLYLSDSNPTMTDITISNNTATRDAGGLYLRKYSNPTMTDITISNNTATRDAGGMYLSDSNPTMTDITISNNTATDDGGGLYLRKYSNPTMTDITISNNTATDDGGGIYIAAESSPVFTAISIIDNYAGDGGGGIYIYSESNPIITNSIIAHNEANTDGGGIVCFAEANPTFTNVTITDNIGVRGGGIFISLYSNPVFQNSIIFYNNDSEVYFSDTSNSDTSSITLDFINLGGSIGGIVFNDYNQINYFTTNLNQPPLFTDPENSDYHLQGTSPCIDAGNPDSEYNDTDGSRNNMGAYGGPGGDW